MSDDGGTPRARIGLIIPSSNRLTEPQFHRYSPPGVVPHVTRLRLTQPPRREPLQMLDEIREAAVLLGHAKCDVIVLHCTGSSMEAGMAAEREVVEAIADASGRRATSTAEAVLQALKAVRARRLVMVSPYRGNDHEIQFVREAGFDVIRDRALALDGSDGLCSAPAELFLESTLAEEDPSADAYFISCTNIRSPEVVEALESRLHRPVVTSNQATLWYCLRLCGLSDAVPVSAGSFGSGCPSKPPFEHLSAIMRPSTVARRSARGRLQSCRLSMPMRTSSKQNIRGTTWTRMMRNTGPRSSSRRGPTPPNTG